MRHLVNTPDSEAITTPIINVENIASIRRAFLTELCSSEVQSFGEGSILNLKLPRTQLITLKEKKLRSLAKKYFSIPVKDLSSYPTIPGKLQESDDEKETGAELRNKKVSRVSNGVVAPKPSSVGRPRKLVVIPN
eukprot:CAMPEP_0184732660 /NCGR_PEP_ID=MMETSP0314-20130426/54976_1 /TAXON_ID=38298 /ORGANISM="Rhodella maculata, Strain CCMP 736" /LENGTH=134 /DNA_ID=CAMNT_0027199297 /DNA_START=25 /DNA_END=426 /DNA_ORIENTATION=+